MRTYGGHPYVQNNSNKSCSKWNKNQIRNPERKNLRQSESPAFTNHSKWANRQTTCIKTQQGMWHQQNIKRNDQIHKWQIQNCNNQIIQHCLSVGCLPDTWNQGLIRPIFKQGDLFKFEPNNYRGMCVNSNPGKIFCSIINTRLQNFLKTYKIWEKSQIGFQPKHRTSDHIYTLHTITDKHVHLNKTNIFLKLSLSPFVFI